MGASDYPKQVYAIQHNITKRMYIGSSKDVRSRYLSHMYQLRAGKHPVEDFQKDFNEYGEDFSLYILDTIDWTTKGNEYRWMRRYNTTVRGIGYNYMDNARRQVDNVDINYPPFKAGLPDEANQRETIGFDKFKDEYITKIINLLDECEVSLLDLILKIITKAKVQND